LRWRLGIRIVEKILDAEKDLLDGDGWFPTFFLVQDGKANRTRRVDVRVEEGRDEFA